jgi:hypothetical protein
MGGIFNTVNSHLYHYAGNNPVKYTDPDGEFTIPWPLVAKALEFIIPAILGVLTTKALNDKKEYFDGSFDDSIIGAKDILDPSSVMDAAPKLRPSIKDGEWQKQFDGPIGKINPSGMTLNTLENNIIDSSQRYANDSDYAAVPDKRKGTTNSNSFAFSILREGLFGGNDELNKRVFSSPEYINNRNKNRQEAIPDVSHWRIPGWDLT